jgi:alpha-glucosidase
MYFQKIRHPSNFSFVSKFNDSTHSATVAGKHHRFVLKDLGSDVFHLQIEGPQPLPNLAQSDLQRLPKHPSLTAITFGPKGEILWHGADGKPLLQSLAKNAFGISGKAWMLQFQRPDGTQFYGQGEKNNGFEKSGKRTKFWNTDIWGDFHLHLCINEVTDPMYVSVPYLIVKQGNSYLGILVDNPYPVFMDTGSNYLFRRDLDPSEPSTFWLGADEGLASVYLLSGPSLHELTCKFQQLCGTTPVPPLWSLGHHQCRWGYRSYADLADLDVKFRRNKIPNDGLWLDIDYMDGFRVFSFDKKHFPNPAKDLGKLNKQNGHVVPILDPGVKLDKQYKVYQDGVRSNIFCENSNGDRYVGFVWPGKTVFPDFSIKEARAWWAKQVKAFAEAGVSGAWLDMNDPSVGAVELDDMRFNHGKLPHTSYHNQYALGMAQASREGFLAARPNERPFLLARSGFTGQSKYSAIWTGDNYSNRFHMRKSIEVTLNLALSGIPFNGPDVPGFGGNTYPELFTAWYKAGFLFPFLRNHAIMDSTAQEPWAFGSRPMEVVRHYIRTRYKLLPYLYNLFIDQEERGAAILRPLFYDFEDTAKLPLGQIDDQFLVGPSLLHAPVYKEGTRSRKVVLPGKNKWFAAHENRWVRGNRKITTTENRLSTPLYVREGAIVPMQTGVRTSNENDLGNIELHLFLNRSTRGTASYQYRFDDGHTFDYRQGKRTAFSLNVTVKGQALRIQVYDIHNGYRPANVRFVVYDRFKKVEVEGLQKSAELALKPLQWNLAGKTLRCGATTAVTIK